MKLIHKEKGMIFRYIPAPRGNMYKLLFGGMVGEVKPFYMAEVPYSVDGRMKVNVSWWECLGISIDLSDAQSYTPNWIQTSTNISNKLKIQDWKGEVADNAIMKLLKSLRIRMPTEFEYEWAALGGENFRYAGCTNWEKTNGKIKTKLRSKCPNGYGLYDMTRDEAVWTSTLTDDNKRKCSIIRGGGPLQDQKHAVVEFRTYKYVLNARGPGIGVRFCIDADKVKS